MNILHVNTNESRGGAAKVARRLIDAQRTLGHTAKFLVGRRKTILPDVVTYPPSAGSLKRDRIIEYGLRILAILERRLGIQYCLRSPNWILRRMKIINDADLIHIHNLHGGYLNLWAVSELSRIKPVVWTLHDEWAYTGHCACTLGCDRWQTGCGKCPDLSIYPAISIDTTRSLWKIKSRSYARGNFTVTAPSNWLLRRVERSMLSGRPVMYIPNGVRSEIFYPRGREATREALGLPRDKRIVIFAANAGSRNPWKGYSYLVEALKKLTISQMPDLLLLAIGDNTSGVDIKTECRWEGRIEDENVMAAYYSAADVFVLPSMAENSPLTVIESMACGTPVVAFDVGGVPELIDHRSSGYIARYRDSDDLAEGIRWILDLDITTYRAMSEAGMKKVRENHMLDQTVNEYLDLYQSVIGNFKDGSRNSVRE
jgi:glycosyltransferase involved in cell wall biosynthesis